MRIVALVPSYAAIGIAAPILVLLCRLVQGFALGGEVGPSTAFLVEAAPAGRRGLYVSLQYAGQGLAVVAAGVSGVALAGVMSDAMLAAWGWRIAMALGVAIVPIGLALRGSLRETLTAATIAQPAPPLAGYARVVVFAFLTLLSTTVATYVLNYMTTYAKTVLRLPSGVAFGASVVVGVATMAGSLIGGVVSDRWGRRPVMIWPMAAATVAVLPGFWLVSRYPGAISLYLVSAVLRLTSAAATTAALVTVTERLPPRIRSGALAIVYALAISVFGGSTQFVIAKLTEVTGDPLAPAWYMLAALLVGLVAMITAREVTASARR
ncbi:MFS transporter, partial [Sphingomonas bacterium]|uniref:MFS transporter n=1 Tax=Sphingomonas bacterium TaxID=1895847 RepID=UPI001575F38D